jgi:hypothetical protein
MAFGIVELDPDGPQDGEVLIRYVAARFEGAPA